MKKILILLVVVLVVVWGAYELGLFNKKAPSWGTPSVNFYDTTYIINGEKVTLKNGLAEKEITPGSASKINTHFFGNEAKGDLNGDGREDAAFILTQETGGSGTFYYAVVSLNMIDGWIGSEAVLLGDRVAPQNTQIEEGGIIAMNYAVRKPGESFAVTPSVGKTLRLKLDQKTMQLGEVFPNFEGEADASRMTLGMKTWNWIRTVYSDGSEVLPRTENKFLLTFKDDQSFSATTDCNSLGGAYIAQSDRIIFSNIVSTMMFCENSQESDFIKMLNESQSYVFTSRGELVFSLKFNNGTVVFR